MSEQIHSAKQSTAQTSSSFAIIIPAWNESDFIETTINSAKNAMQQCHHDGRIIVVDNNSSDDTGDIAVRAGAEVVFEPINQIARARNTGARAANTDWLVFLDADTKLSTELLNASLDALASGKVIGGGSIITLDKNLSGFAKFGLSTWNWWSKVTRSAAGCFIYCDRESFEDAGGFDEKRYVAEELFLSKSLRALAKQRGQEFVIQTVAPVVSSARKLDWYSPGQMLWQILCLLTPFSTTSKKRLSVWYDRTNIRRPDK